MFVRALAFAAVCLGVASTGCTRLTTKSNEGLAPARRDGERPGVAVVELFTSEGCSSCPAAEPVLARLVEEARANGEPIFAIEYHVDYWDEIGWKDPWSSAAFTERQGEYARAWGRTSMYTPEAIVDGQDEMVGSDEDGLRAAIARALDRPATVDVNVARAVATEPGSLALDISVTPPTKDARALIALVEGTVTSNVTAGENAGQTLHHTNVVRSLQVVEATSHATVSVAMPAGLNGAVVVAWVQRVRDGRIVGATSLDL